MASSAFSPPLFLLSLFFSFLLTSAAPSAIKLPLYPFAHHHPSQPADPYQTLNRLAVTSLARASRIKHPAHRHDETADAKSPLFPRSYGGYSVSMGFGTPPQTVPFVFDTGSSLVWFPCTSHYLCSRCDFPNVDLSKIPRFVPKNSTSAKIIGCKNPKCQWIFGSGAKCGKCDTKKGNCTENCPAYIIQYGLGSTAGILLSETLSFSDRTVPDFLVGCSIVSNRQPAGIAGFGRGSESLPSQMGLKKFSYCLVSRRFDDSPVSSDLVLETGSGNSDTKKTPGLSYTPFRKNPDAFKDYYYVSLRRIVVGEKRVKIPYEFLEPGSDGSGGSIIDSGSTFTFMEQPVFELVAKEFETQMRNLSRAVKIEKRTGLSPCFNISGEKTGTKIPSLKFEFKGGAAMELPLTNYFAIASNDVVCMTIVSNSEVEPTAGVGGPAIILGSFQLQNYNVEFDLENDRFGFAKKRCA